jgi:oligoribonuclease (3'-5' exoribonuclease)
LKVGIHLTKKKFFIRYFISGPDIVIHHDQEVLDKMNDWSRKQHTKSGLIQLIQQSQISLYDAETTVIDFLKRYCVAGTGILAGNSVFVDRWQVLSDFNTSPGPRKRHHKRYKTFILENAVK